MGDGAITVESDYGPSRFRDLFRIRAFVVLYFAEAQSIIGDQLARVALSVLVFRQTNSAALTSLTYATTYLPAILGGVLLARIGDTRPRRTVMIGCDVARALLFAAMAVPSLATWPVLVLLTVAVFLGPAFSAAEVSYLAAVLSPDLFRAGTGLRMITNQAAQVFGFAAGGILVAALGPRGALIVDAGTYVVSAAAVAIGLRGKSPQRRGLTVASAERVAGSAVIIAEVWRNRRLRLLLALSALAGLFIVPEGLAVPFGSATGATTAEVGLLLASIPLGGAVGVVVLVRFVPHHLRARVARAMAIGCGLPLAIAAVIGTWPAAIGCWFVSGALAAYQVEVFTVAVQSVPDALRSRLVGLGSSVLLGAQGIGLLVFGWVAHLSTPSRAIGFAGLLGSVLAAALVAGYRHTPDIMPALSDESVSEGKNEFYSAWHRVSSLGRRVRR